MQTPESAIYKRVSVFSSARPRLFALMRARVAPKWAQVEHNSHVIHTQPAPKWRQPPNQRSGLTRTTEATRPHPSRPPRHGYHAYFLTSGRSTARRAWSPAHVPASPSSPRAKPRGRGHGPATPDSAASPTANPVRPTAVDEANAVSKSRHCSGWNGSRSELSVPNTAAEMAIHGSSGATGASEPISRRVPASCSALNA